MAGEKIKLTIETIQKYSNTLNTASQNLGSACDDMYKSITGIKDQSFKSKIAEEEYYINIEDLNKKVPVFRDGVLKFSEFLLSQVIATYDDGEDKAKAILKNELDEAIKQLATIGMIGGATVDMTKISATAQGAISGEGWIKSDKINTEAFSDTGNLEFVTRDDGAVMITRNGVPIGFTTEAAMKPSESAESVATATTSVADEKVISQADYNDLPEEQRKIVDGEGYKVVSDSEFAKMSQGEGQSKAGSYDGSTSSNATNENFMNNQMMRNNPDVAKASKLASNTEGMGNNEAIIKARENGTLSPNESVVTSVAEEKIMSQSVYNKLRPEAQVSVDNSGYKVVSNSEYAKMSQGTGQNRADSYDRGVSSNTTNNTTTNTAEFDSNVFYNQNITSTNNQNPDAGSIIEAAFKLDNQKKDASSIAETAFKIDS